MMDFSFGYENGVETSYNMPMSNQEVRTRVSIYPADPFFSQGPRWSWTIDVIEPNKIRIISNRDRLPRETSFYQVTEENSDFLYVHGRSRDEKGHNIEADWWMKRKVEAISRETQNVRRR